MPPWIQMLIVCATLLERLKRGLVYKALHWTEDCVQQVSDSFDWAKPRSSSEEEDIATFPPAAPDF